MSATNDKERPDETRDEMRQPADELEDLEPSKQTAAEVRGGMGINRLVVTDGTVKG